MDLDWSTITLTALTSAALNAVIFGFWKPWLGAYGGEKGKNLARKEDLNEILAEVRAVTITQKEIESKLAGDLWQKHNVWNEKKDIYATFLTTIHNALNALTDFDSILRRLPDGQTVESSPAIKAALLPPAENFGKAFGELIRLQSTALLFTSPLTMNIISGYFRSVGGDLNLQTLENVHANRDTLVALNVDLVASAKRDLGIESD